MVPHQIMEQFAQRLGFQAAQGQNPLGRALDLFVRQVHQLEQTERKVRGTGSHRLPAALRKGEQLVKLGRRLPVVLILGQHQRQDGREFCRGAALLGLPFPDAHHVGKQSQPHERGFRALVFPQDVKQGGGPANLRAEEQVGFGAFHSGVDEGTGDQCEGVPVDERRKRALEVVPEEGRRVPRIGKGGAEQFVVRLVNGFFRHEGAQPAENTAAAQRSCRAPAADRPQMSQRKDRRLGCSPESPSVPFSKYCLILLPVCATGDSPPDCQPISGAFARGPNRGFRPPWQAPPTGPG